MQNATWGQVGYAVRFEWGLTGATHIAAPTGALVIIDVLSFTTTVSLAVNAGTWVYPYVWSVQEAREFAATVGASVAVHRHEVDATHPYSLSPASILRAPAVGRLVLPSPNGSTIALEVSQNGLAGEVIAACVRNARAVARWCVVNGFGTTERPLSVIAAGERWPDGSLRPAIEDLMGAGAVLQALSQELVIESALWSPEAAAALAAYAGIVDVPGRIRGSGSSSCP